MKKNNEYGRDEKKSGVWTEYYESGQKAEEGKYKKGEKVGLWTGWYENGQKEWEIQYKDNKKVSHKKF